MRYPGGKGKSYQHVINLMPPHRVYIETHLGGGSVLSHKLPAEKSVALDVDERAIAAWDSTVPRLQLLCARAEDFLATYQFRGDELVYADPPYHPTTRRRTRVYNHDYTDEDHRVLLALLITLPCMVIISGYANSLYEERLQGWRTRTFRAKTHTDVRTETLWFNFEPPSVLHDSSYLGTNFRDRQSAKRRMERLKEKFSRMDVVERSAITRWLHETFPLSNGSPI